MSEPEFSRIVRVHPQPPESLTIAADEPEREALARRFGVEAISALSASVAFAQDGETIAAKGRLSADLIQNCAVSGDDFPTRIDEPLDLRFVPEGSLAAGEDEIDFDSSQADEVEFAGDSFDLGEAVAQSLGLAVDPYAEGPGAEEARRAAGLTDDSAPRGPLADLLQGLKRD